MSFKKTKKILVSALCLAMSLAGAFGCASTPSTGDGTTAPELCGGKITTDPSDVQSTPDNTLTEDAKMENLTVKSGSFDGLYGAFKSMSSNSLAICDKSFTDGTLKSSVMLGTEVGGGIIFRASFDGDASYYYFHLQGTQVRFSKIVNGESHLIKASDSSRGIGLRKEAELKVVVDGNKFTGYVDGICYLSYTDENALDGTGVGIFADAAGVVFYNSEISSEKKLESADIVMIGHSHTTHWATEAEDLRAYGKVVNLGIGGTITPQWMSRIDEMTSYNAKKYVVWLGSNDARVGISNDVTLDRLNVMFRKIADKIPDAEIYLFTEFYQFDSYRVTETFRSQIRDLNAKYRKTFSGVNIVDIFDVVLNPDGSVNTSLYSDELHLKSENYVLIKEKLLAAMASPVKVNENTGKAMGKYAIGEGTNNAWTYTEEANGIKLVSNEANTVVTLSDKVFAGGTVEFKMYIPNDAAYSGKRNVSGVIFGANDYYIGHGTGNYYCVGQHKNGEMVGFAVNNSASSWVHANKTEKNFLKVGNTYTVKLVWDRENNAIHYFIDGVYRMTTKAEIPLYGDKIGFYADGAGVVFSEIRISDNLELDNVDVFYMYGTNADWTVEGSGDLATYKTVPGKLMMFNKDFGDADKWVIEFDITAHDTAYVEKRVSGIVFGASSPTVNKTDAFAVSGYCYNSGELNTFSYENGFGRWEDSVKVRNFFAGLNEKCHVKLVWDKKAGTVEYYDGDTLIATQKLSLKLSGNYFGLMSDFSVTISSISITAVK